MSCQFNSLKVYFLYDYYYTIVSKSLISHSSKKKHHTHLTYKKQAIINLAIKHVKPITATQKKKKKKKVKRRDYIVQIRKRERERESPQCNALVAQLEQLAFSERFHYLFFFSFLSLSCSCTARCTNTESEPLKKRDIYKARGISALFFCFIYFFFFKARCF